MSVNNHFLIQQVRLLCTSVPLAACTHCRLVRSRDPSTNTALLDLYEELLPGDNNAQENNVGNHVLRVVKRKGSLPWRSTYDMYLPPTLAGQPSDTLGILVGRVVPTSAGGVYTILQRSFPSTDDIGSSSLSDDLLWQEVCAVQYDSHVLGSTGPREMTVVIHAVDDSGDNNAKVDDGGGASLIERYRGDGAEMDAGIIPLINKPPIFIPETSTFALDFGARVTMRSVKNFQLIHPHDKDYIVMQFGKTGADSFALDIRYPMSPVMALGVAVTSIDRKVIYNLSLPQFSSTG
ncbi:hypothetical protein IWW38_003108 [Coemansia aciculifera]|uniref:Uncharacterized protein n=1 Tax=Coemansia aciculifera TaxID=417176 RepID=A0ACC1M2D6_9FUNG|nr:hypothetical protein IWW38_003108 [Coemansia aciculifera]